MKKLVNDKADYILTFLFLLCLLMFFFIYRTPDMDEIWNYQFARRILYDHVPYKDFYLLQTPFAAQINSIFLSVFSDKLVVLRIVGAIITALNGFIIYLVLRLTGKGPLISFLLILVYSFLAIIYPQNNYSWYAVLFLSSAFFIEVIKVKKADIPGQNFYELFIGILLGFATISKQNIGIFGLLGSLFFLIVHNYKTYDKYQRRFLFKGTVPKISGWLIIVAAEMLYLFRHGAIVEFFDQTIVSTASFGKNCAVPYASLFCNENPLLIKILALIVPLSILTVLIKGIFSYKSAEQKNLVLILAAMYALANFSMMFPVSDTIHLALAAPVSLVSMALLIGQMKREEKRFIIVFLGSTLLFICLSYSKISHDYTFMHDLKHYENVPFTQNAVQTIKEIDDFIIQEEKTGKQLFFLNFRAPFYLIPIDRFNYKSDVMFSGNLGTCGEKEIIQKIASTRNIFVLIRGEELQLNRQEITSFEDYVRSNLKYSTSIHGFDVFID